MRITKWIFSVMVLVMALQSNAQPVMETGGQKMPNEWIDKSTGHKLIKLTRKEGSSISFYFHNNPFIGNKMVFYNSRLEQPGAVTDMKRQEATSLNVKDKQLYTVDLATLAIEQLTHHPSPMGGEIVSQKRKDVFFQVKDSVYLVNVDTKKQKLVFVFPADFKGSITTVNADGTYMGKQEAVNLIEKFKGSTNKIIELVV